MRKKTTLFFAFLPLAAMAQNFQLHYDFGQGRHYVTTTFEMFKPDDWGNTFFFVDYDFNMDRDHNASLSYMELSRCFSLGKTSPFSVQVEYNGGLFAMEGSAYPIQNAFLIGLDYGWHNNNFDRFLNFKVLYKNIVGKHPLSFQLTGVWDLSFYNKRISVCGFADFWREDNLNFTDAAGKNLDSPVLTRYVFISEPQFWYNITPHLSAGSEIEIAANFSSVYGLKICPTLGMKWNF